MKGFALFRQPYGSVATWMEGPVEELPSYASLNSRQGFVVAPFVVSDEEPVLLILPERTLTAPVSRESFTFPEVVTPPTEWTQVERMHYAVDFANFHAHLLNDDYRKLVLSRCVMEHKSPSLSPSELFWRACENYPRLFIALTYTPQSGLWLVATPEVLLEGKDGRWRTMALAGTVKLCASQLQQDIPQVDWSVKNIQEQRYVATYMMECLQHFTNHITEDGPRTTRAANLVHLRSDFTFSLPTHDLLGDLLQTLHPTPAVCGLTKRDACRFILSNEHTPRHYYSGFMGPLDAEGDTHLYVSLRCMKIEGDDCYLYAGGGLLRESTEEQEWQETEAKMETMRRLLQTEK